MTKMVEEAIEALKDLPKERQVTVARAILDYAAHDDGLYHLTDDERRDVHSGLAEIQRGDLATDDEVAELYKRFAL